MTQLEVEIEDAVFFNQKSLFKKIERKVFFIRKSFFFCENDQKKFGKNAKVILLWTYNEKNPFIN